MPWVEFTRVFRWRPTPNTSIRYAKGSKKNVTRRCAEKAIATGAAVKIEALKGAEGEADADEDPQSGPA